MQIILEKVNLGQPPSLKFHGNFITSPSQGIQIRPILLDADTQQDILLISNELQIIGTFKWKQILSNGEGKLSFDENEKILQFARNDYILKLQQNDGLIARDEPYKFQCTFKSENGTKLL